MDDARVVVGDLIEEYAAAGKSDFLEWCARRDEADKAKAK
jgi:archaeosine-15-forming tRNA-guanine transglycosylase